MKWVYISSIALLFACSKPENKKVILSQGTWLMTMDLGQNVDLPFQFELSQSNGSWEMVIINAEEKIVIDDIKVDKDSIRIELPVFESYFDLVIKNDSLLEGTWTNLYKGSDYNIPVRATSGFQSRFTKTKEESIAQIEKRYKSTFSPSTEDKSLAVGLFQQQGDLLTGTFATETGDYRHLEGNVIGQKLYLSTFDGSHAFLFTANISGDSLTEGKFYSGTHWEENWVAVKNDTFELRNADSLTYLTEGYDSIYFEFPDINGKLVSLNDKRYLGKPVIVQIMGTWCPNCLDETKYFKKLYDKYNNDGLEIIALAFERTRSVDQAIKNVERLKIRTNLNYEILIGGATRKDRAAEKLPMLNHVMSYPTAIFIDQQRNIRRIHTGFYGPSTGIYYENYVTETELLVEDMLGL